MCKKSVNIKCHFQKDFQSPKLEKLESTEEFNYEYQVYVARTDHREDESKALEIEKYLRDHMERTNNNEYNFLIICRYLN
jgi:hypothetical protein